MSTLLLLIVWFLTTSLLAWAFGRELWRELPVLLRLYLAAGCALVSIGAIQTIFSVQRFDSFSEAALWFATAGIAVSLTGALNLLNVAKRREDVPIRRVALAANVLITAVFIAIATHRGEALPHDVVSISFIVLGVTATVLSGVWVGWSAHPEAKHGARASVDTASQRISKPGDQGLAADSADCERQFRSS